MAPDLALALRLLGTLLLALL
eukprot:COSAG04_NODE_3969_length_2389_cov_2.134061_2_plen_20_part_01